MPGEAKAASRLLEARKLIEKGWCQGAWARTEDGVAIEMGGSRKIPASLCLAAALIKPGGVDGLGPALWLVRDVIGTGNISKWNDAPGRTKAEVVKALADAAARA